MPDGTVVHNHAMKRNMDAIGFYGPRKSRAVYSDMMEEFAKDLIERTSVLRYQNVIVVEGRTGSGKSTYAVELAQMISPKFDLQQDYIYDTDDLIRKLERAEAGIKDICPVSLLDEGTVTLNSKNAQGKDDKKLIVLLQLMRSLNWTTIICVPMLRNLNKDIKEQLVDYLVKCPEQPLVSSSKVKGKRKVSQKYTARGFFEVYIPKFPKFSDQNGKMYWKLIGAGVYPPLDAKTDREYQAIKFKHQMIWMHKNYTKKDEKKEEYEDASDY